jgi:hypothetical protein
MYPDYHALGDMITRMVHILRLFILALMVQCVGLGADLAGIWTGETTGRNGEKQDIAFQFKMSKSNLAGVMFGDEFDLPLEELKVEGNKVSFSVTNINYYSGSRISFIFNGTITGKEMQLTRERKGQPLAGERPTTKQTITLKRIT